MQVQTAYMLSWLRKLNNCLRFMLNGKMTMTFRKNEITLLQVDIETMVTCSKDYFVLYLVHVNFGTDGLS